MVTAGERLDVYNDAGTDWWLVRRLDGACGFIPASYAEKFGPTASAAPTPAKISVASKKTPPPVGPSPAALGAAAPPSIRPSPAALAMQTKSANNSTGAELRRHSQRLPARGQLAHGQRLRGQCCDDDAFTRLCPAAAVAVARACGGARAIQLHRHQPGRVERAGG